MNNSMNHTSISQYDSLNQLLSHNKSSYQNKNSHQGTNTNHMIDFNHLNEKLKKLKHQAESEDYPSGLDYKRLASDQRDRAFLCEGKKSSEKKVIPRSKSNMDKQHCNSERLNQDNIKAFKGHQNCYGLNQVSNEFFSRIKEYPEKNKLLLRKSLNLENSKQHALQQTRKISESLRTDSSCSESETSQSGDNSFQSDSAKSLSNFSRSSSSLPLKGKHHLTNTKSSTNKQIKRGLSALDVINKQKIIVLRREKSIAYQTTNHKSLKQPIKPKKHSKKQSSNNLHKDNSVNEKHSIMKKRLLASLNITSSNHNDQANNSNIQLISTTSSTTSGVELSSKNSTNGANSVHYDDSSDNVHRIDLKNTNKSMNRSDENEEKLDNTDSLVKKLKNQIFILEFELENQTKKLYSDKELKQKQIDQLKSRYETETNAALKALEAKLNAEKLLELNKLKENIDFENRDETDQYQKKLDCDLLSLKLKLREKSEKCSKLEKMLKEEKMKNSQLFAKSMEIVNKYNQEIKGFKDNKTCTYTSQYSSVQTQTQNSPFNNHCIEKLFYICNILESMFSCTRQKIPKEIAETSDLTSLMKKIELLTNELKISLEKSQEELKLTHKQSEKLRDDLKSCKETKAKLESLYKIKCKSDLNKSAQIKKCQMNFELELIKFRNESNFDLVQYLEIQLAAKEVQLLDQKNQLEDVCELLEGFNDAELNNDILVHVKRIKESIKSVNCSKNSRTSLRDGGSNKNMSRVNNVSKVFAPEVLFVRINDESNCQISNDTHKEKLIRSN